ncbi:SDR family oxidoreductase [Sphingosinicella sp.]|uniref:SDR family oxidoreductase n=1 Tax=Sphingosinicella sp. TaxID=1917971 RepID=UPI0040383719
MAGASLRVLLLGATGLIGSAVAARLQADGHEVVGVARRQGPATRRVPVARWIALDMRHATCPEDWTPHLAGIDAVVNCAGVLQDGAGDFVSLVHRDAPAALWRACEAAGVKRVIQMSALGADTGGSTAFLRTKQDGDRLLEASQLDWVILRPSVVVGRPAYGGSALFRALAALPWLPRFPDAGRLDVVQLDDVAETVVHVLEPGAPSRVKWELAGPDRLAVSQVIGSYRRWLGWPPAREIGLPNWLLAIGWKAGDLLSWLGWRPPLRTTARRELARGSTGDNRAWIETTGIQPRSLAAALAAEPSDVQERWFARLYLLKPVLLAVFVAFWLLTGIVSLTAGWDRAVAMMAATGVGRFAAPAVAGGALADLAIAALVAWRPTARLGLLSALALSLGYIIAGSALAPSLWADPLGPLMKILPILALNLACLAILDDR